MEKRLYRWGGAAAGAINGLFGGGGGMVLVPLLLHDKTLRAKEVFACAVAVIAPLCAVSFLARLPAGDFSFVRALPYLLGGALGGALGGRLYRRMPPQWLKRLFALFLFYGAWRYLT